MKATRVFLWIGLSLLLLLAVQGCSTSSVDIVRFNILSRPDYFVLPDPLPADLTASPNPCTADGTWLIGDSFKLINPPDGISVPLLPRSQSQQESWLQGIHHQTWRRRCFASQLTMGTSVRLARRIKPLVVAALFW